MSKVKGEEVFAGWDDNEASDIDFFGESNATEDVVAAVENEDVDDEDTPPAKVGETDDTPAAETSEEEGEGNAEDDIDFFGTTPEEEEEGEESDEEEEEESDEDDIKPKDTKKPKKERASKVKPQDTLKYLKEKGLIEYELEDGQEMTDSLAEEIMEDDFDNRVETRIEELVADMPDVVKNLNKFVASGGNAQEFLSNLVNTQSATPIKANMDMTQESNQELIVRHQLAAEGNDNDTIETQIDFLKTSGKLEKFANGKFNNWKKQDDINKTALIEKQKNYVKMEKENKRKLKEKVSTILSDKNSIGGLKLTRAEKKALPVYMTEKTVKTASGNYITEMQSNLMTALQDDEKAILIAKLVKSDFDITAVIEDADDKAAKKAKAEVTRSKGNKTPSKSGKTGSPRKRGSLADFF